MSSYEKDHQCDHLKNVCTVSMNKLTCGLLLATEPLITPFIRGGVVRRTQRWRVDPCRALGVQHLLT